MHGDRAALYRAMRSAERDETIASGSPVFLHGHKFFSDDLGWIVCRVRCGAFRGREAGPHDYSHVLSFSIPKVDLSLFRRLNEKEWVLSARDACFLRAEIEEIDPASLEVARLRALWAARA